MFIHNSFKYCKKKIYLKLFCLESEDPRNSEDEAKASLASGIICYKLLHMFLLFLFVVIFDTCVLTKQPTNKCDLHEIKCIFIKFYRLSTLWDDSNPVKCGPCMQV